MFNITYLHPYLEDDYLSNLRLNYFKNVEEDGGPSSQPNVTPLISQGSLNLQFTLKIWFIFCKGTKQKVMGWTSCISPVLCTLFLRTIEGLSLLFLDSITVKEVY